MLNYFPKYFSRNSIFIYIGIIFICNIIFFHSAQPLLWLIFGVLEVYLFFYFSNTLSKRWSNFSEKKFLKKVFITGFIIRVIYVIFSYFFYIEKTGIPFEFGAADALFYQDISNFGSDLISKGNFNFYAEFKKYAGNRLEVGDVGYPVYVSFIYFLTGKSIIALRLIKALLGAWTAVILYRVTKRSFGENAARITSIFAMLFPLFIFYVGLHIKEVEMVFVTTLFLDRTDALLRERNFNFLNIFIVILLVAVMFFLRAVLVIAAVFAIFTGLTLTANKIMGFGKRFIITLWAVIALGLFAGGSLYNEAVDLIQRREAGKNQALEWRAEREGGNKFATMASGAIFAPMILIMPFGTVINIDTQPLLMMNNGGYHDKSMLAFFVLFTIVLLIKEKRWREHIFTGSFMIFYLLIIAFSDFAQSERFHQPALPVFLMFAGYGVTRATNKTKKYFSWYMVLIFVIMIGWSWFKLAGRGLA